jgi:hypothetical protein
VRAALVIALGPARNSMRVPLQRQLPMVPEHGWKTEKRNVGDQAQKGALVNNTRGVTRPSRPCTRKEIPMNKGTTSLPRSVLLCASAILFAHIALSQQTTSVAAPHKYALLIGINNYEYSNPNEGFPNLNGCVNDILRMQKILLSFGFDPKDIAMMKDSNASHDAVLQAIHQLALKAAPGDVVVIHFSGHGSHITDPARINGVDETLVAYDSRNPRKTDDPTGGDITGEQLNQAINQIRTKHITVIIDACYSAGLISRSISTGLSRSIPPYKSVSVPPAAPTMQAPIRGAGASFVLIAAAQQNQEAQEYAPNGAKKPQFGTLTYFLTSEIQSHLRTSVTYKDIFPAVREEVRTVHPSQVPSLEGTNEDEAVFSDQSVLLPGYVEVKPGPAGSLTLEAGDVLGVTKGSLFDVYPPDSHDLANKAQRLVTAEIASTSPYTSVATLSNVHVSVPIGSRAVETSHVYPNTKFRVFLDGVSNSTDLQAIERGLATLPNVESSRVPDGTKIRVAETASSIVLYSADSGERLATVNPGDGLTDRSMAAIALWAKWFNILSIVNENASVNVHVGVITDAAAAHEGNDGSTTIADGETFRIKFENLSAQDLYISVVDLKQNGGVQTIYQSGVRALPAGGNFQTSEFQAALPKGLDAYTDILKVFATDKQVDFAFLNQSSDGRGVKGLRPRGAESALGQLLAQAGFGYSRDVVAVPSDWVTVQQVLKVRPSTQSANSQ